MDRTTLEAQLRDRWSEQPVWGEVECGEGWDDLVARLDRDLCRLVPGYRLVQVKQKFGGLRYYVDLPEGTTPEMLAEAQARIDEAERESLRTCEDCGAPTEPGMPRPGRNRCARCTAGA